MNYFLFSNKFYNRVYFLAKILLLNAFIASGVSHAQSDGNTQNIQNNSEAVIKADPKAVASAYGAFQRGYYKTAYEIAINNAKANDQYAQALLGLIYAGGFGVKQDIKEAANWFKRSADQGNKEAEFELGFLYLKGQGVEKNPAMAFELFQKSAAQGHIAAQFNAAIAYLNGVGTKQDIPKALQLLEKNAKSGYPNAFYTLGLLFKKGEMVDQDIPRAANLIGTAAQFGLTAAQLEYGIMVFQGQGTQQNPEIAAAWIKKAADKGSPVAINRLARLYAKGIGVPKDEKRALVMHFVSSANGVSDLWMDGFIAEQDEKLVEEAKLEARKWFSPFALANNNK